MDELKTLELKLKHKHNGIYYLTIDRFESAKAKTKNLNKPFKGRSIIS